MPEANDRALMTLVYRSLVADSLIPSAPRQIGELAVNAVAGLSGGEASELPEDFGRDLERDAQWLTERLPTEGPWWSVFHAMAWGCGKPHTNLVDPTFGVGMRALMSGEPLTSPGFFLIGQADGRLAVMDLAEGGSALACGLRAGDVLVAVDGVPARRPSSQFMPFYVAPAGSEFGLLIERAGARQQLALRLQPGNVPGVTWRLLEGGVGYLNVRWFAASKEASRHTGALALGHMREMAAAGAKGLIIDVRSGMGGMLEAAVVIASALCDAKVIVAHRDAQGVDRDIERLGEPLWFKPPLVVLVNEQTMSAAECLALALEECADATIVGVTTAGGLNSIRMVPLAEGYNLALPGAPVIGPRSRAPRPGHRLEPSVVVANPTTAELAAGGDPQLEAARTWILNHA